MNIPTALELVGVSKSYGPLTALNNVSLSIKPAQFIGLLGQNGAGKTTLFQLLTGLFNSDEGQISVCGHDISQDPIGALSTLGVVFQQATLDLDLTVHGNLKFHCLLHGLSRKLAEERINSELDRFDMQAVRDKQVRSLSGGNRRKIELIRALLHQPKVLLMDEATVGLDPESRKSLVNHVVSLCKEREIAVLWSTHIVEEVQAADRVIVLDKGKILAESSPEELQAQGIEPNLSLADAFSQLINNNKEIGVAYE
ncbi:ABC transporter ATP-binding protein [Neptuniibacter pectenicola]|uniref:ABC transporter ATP-binding protein n=1 Tax=Neptuniibacter pectenicola TaxID=1806669 RepID=UPI0030ECF754|tara:strand:+ start:2703 stop:3467 length:765 start_codon:yes stop_codon:yes gene_type:complete